MGPLPEWLLSPTCRFDPARPAPPEAGLHNMFQTGRLRTAEGHQEADRRRAAALRRSSLRGLGGSAPALSW